MLLPLLVFLSVTLAVAGLLLWLLPSRAEERLHAVAPGTPTGRGEWSETVVRVASPLARLSAPEGDWETSPLRRRFMHAGIRHPDVRLYYFAAKTVLPLAFAGWAFYVSRSVGNPATTTLMLMMVLSALVGMYLPNLVLHVMVRRRQREVFENFPDAADLMLICVEAGLGLDAAMTRVAEEIRRKSLAVAEELHLTNLEIRAGSSREKALHNLALRTGVEETMTFAAMLTQADRFGTSVGESLRVFSEDLRVKRLMRAEEHAAKVPTKMLFPLVFFIFPSIIMVVLGPAVIQMIRTLAPMLGMTG